MIGIIVKVEKGLAEALAQELNQRAHIRIQAVKDDGIALVLDTDDLHILAARTKEFEEMDGVLGVYPVFSRDSLVL
jgi:nitrate reductase NapAB chaperone NapD